MEKFMGKDFLLSTETARKLYHETVEKMPILDYHYHISPQEIAEDRKCDDHERVPGRRRRGENAARERVVVQ